MTLLSLLIALLLEQLRPIRQANLVHAWVIGKIEDMRGMSIRMGPALYGRHGSWWLLERPSLAS